jgi:hypothetical protein
MSRAAYMREYRARKRAAQDKELDLVVRAGSAVHDMLTPDIEALRDENARLLQEIVYLKRELAQRPARDPFREFRPAPKPGK